ncbi:peptidase [Candidatus Saccharibacteria bacterium]|nr:peptidase [Candidatus Saccharibacteria bacterium]
MIGKILIGRVEKIAFPDLGGNILHARIDTGAKTSSIWASETEEVDAGLRVRFMAPGHDVYEDEIIFPHYDRVCISSSMGHKQLRYRIKMPIVMQKRRIMATFTLADRSSQTYPVLIGRSTLHGKFIVDVQLGSPLVEAEKRRLKELQAHIKEEHI